MCEYCKIQLGLFNEREKIKTDLLRIADSGEYEDLRREVENYFKDDI